MPSTTLYEMQTQAEREVDENQEKNLGFYLACSTSFEKIWRLSLIVYSIILSFCDGQCDSLIQSRCLRRRWQATAMILDRLVLLDTVGLTVWSKFYNYGFTQAIVLPQDSLRSSLNQLSFACKLLWYPPTWGHRSSIPMILMSSADWTIHSSTHPQWLTS